MKVLILSNNFGGLYHFRREVVQAMIDKRYCVTISAPYDEFTPLFEGMGCGVETIEFNRKGVNPFKDFLLLIKYCQVIKKLHPDVVLSYTIKPNIYGGIACSLCNVPQLANITGLGSAVENPGWLQRLTILLYRIGLRKTHITFFQNKANKAFCEQHKMVKGLSILLPGSGVNLNYHTLVPYPNKDEPIKFIFISRLVREKGIDEYLGAAEIIKQKYQSVQFHILGSCEDAYGERLKDFQEKGIVIYHGSQPDVRPYLAEVHCTVHPSFYPEGMSNVLLESCAAGRPIITTDRPGCGEIVEDNRNGFLVKAKSIEDLSLVIERFINLSYDEKKQMGIEGRKKAEHEFDRQIVVDVYMNELDKLSYV